MIGLRTNVLVSLGAFLFVSLSVNIINADNTRIAAQVVSGIGFLGAGVILRDGNKVKGLNTAATLWCVAAIGILTAYGMIIESLIGTIFILISNIILRIFAKKIMKKLNQEEMYIINIKCFKEEEKFIKTLLIELTNKYNFNIKSFEKNETENNEINIKINISSIYKSNFNEIVKTITVSSNINSLYIEHNSLTNPNNEDINDE